MFLWATLLPTLLYLDRFHPAVDDVPARAAAWIWLAVYIADPILLTTALVLQWRAPGEDPPRTTPRRSGYRSTLLASALVIGVVGAISIAMTGIVAAIGLIGMQTQTSSRSAR